MGASFAPNHVGMPIVPREAKLDFLSKQVRTARNVSGGWWVTILILVREWGVTALRFFVIRYGVIPASRGGKLKTVIQTVAIFLYILPLASIAPWLGVVAFAVMMVALAITVWTGVEYVIEALKLRASGIRARQQKIQEGKS